MVRRKRKETMSKQYLPSNTSKRFTHPDDRASSFSRQELMDAYDRLKGKKKGRTQLEENGFVVACPHCQNHDIEKIVLVEAMVEFRSITKVENGTIYYGDPYDTDWTADPHFECKLCHQEFAVPTKANMEHECG